MFLLTHQNQSMSHIWVGIELTLQTQDPQNIQGDRF